MARKTPEWIGKTDNTKIPDRVHQRVFDRAGGVCHICKQRIKVPFETWETDHVIALVNGGTNTEDNLAPAHSHCHLGKTARDVKEKSKVAKVRAKHTGVKRPSSKLAGRKIEKLPLSKSLPPRRLYQERTS